MDYAAQLQHYTVIYDSIGADGVVHRTSVNMSLRYTFRYEAELVLEKAGFNIEEVYGSYQFDRFGDADERMIFVARAANPPLT